MAMTHCVGRTSGTAAFIITALIATLTGAAAFALFLVASYGALPGDPSIFRGRVAEAFRKGQLVENPYQEGSTSIGSHQWNDCLIIIMAMDQRGGRDRLALSPILPSMPAPLSVSTNPCAVLSALNKGVRPKDDIYYYDRYVHGAVVLLRYLLPGSTIKEIRTGYRNTQSFCLVLGLALAMLGLARGERVASFAVIGTTIVALMRYFGLESFSQSLGHGPADTIIAGYALALAAMAFAPTGLAAAVFAAAVFGALTIIFELFTGGFPLGLAMVVGLAPLVVRPAERPALVAACAAAAFAGAGATMYALKMAAVVMASGPGIATDAVHEVLRLTFASQQGAGFMEAAHPFKHSIGVLTGGMRLLSFGTLVIAGLCGSFGLLRLWRRERDPMLRDRALILALSTLIIPAWCLLFSNLLINHAWFTDRILVWLVAAGFGLFFMALSAREAPPRVP
jgi:hypothetical protein